MAISNSMVLRASIQNVRNSTRAFILLKPCTIYKKQIGSVIGFLSKRLDDNGVKHRFVAPMLANMSNGLIETLYSEHAEKDWFKSGFKPFMRGRHPDKRIPSCPIAAFMLEMKNIPGKDMFAILRGDDVIGPTNPFEAIAKFPEKAAQVKKSVRYNLVGNDLIKPWEGINCPVMNRIHCSADGSAAENELSAFYLSIFEFMLPYYSKDAAEFLQSRLESKVMKYNLTDYDFRVTLLSNRAGYYSILPDNFTIFGSVNYFALLAQENKYRDFDKPNIHEIFGQMRDLLPTIEKAQNDFLSDHY